MSSQIRHRAVRIAAALLCGAAAVLTVSACAAGFRAEQLIFLTDVDGVLDGAKRLCAELTAADCERLIADGVATGGMQAKLNAATSALKQGVGQVRIAPGAVSDALSRVLSGEALGTKLV